MTKTDLVNYIKARILTNGTKSITGAKHQEALLAVVDQLDDLKTSASYIPSGTGWKRIATSPISMGRLAGTFKIHWYGSTSTPVGHGVLIFQAGCQYGVQPNITQTLYSATGGAISEIRLVYHTNYSGNFVYVEVNLGLSGLNGFDVELTNNQGFTLLTTSTDGSIPSGYSTVSLLTKQGVGTTRQLFSDLATGTPPLVVASNTLIPNLNADLLDGKHASEFASALNRVLSIGGTSKTDIGAALTWAVSEIAAGRLANVTTGDANILKTLGGVYIESPSSTPNWGSSSGTGVGITIQRGAPNDTTVLKSYQLFFDYTTPDLFKFRGGSAASATDNTMTWTAWRTVLHSGNSSVSGQVVNINGVSVTVPLGITNLGLNPNLDTIFNAGVYIYSNAQGSWILNVIGQGSTDAIQYRFSAGTDVGMVNIETREFYHGVWSSWKVFPLGIDLYSTAEQLTGEIFNGKPVYSKMISYSGSINPGSFYTLGGVASLIGSNSHYGIDPMSYFVSSSVNNGIHSQFLIGGMHSNTPPSNTISVGVRYGTHDGGSTPEYYFSIFNGFSGTVSGLFYVIIKYTKP